ncbi:DUF4865 family protein [Clostridium hydrogenum]|uniref:DUF4865 family protein n=1 Tax=Clostridium hydrogenum TaxID=2855764 RepID=UPI001F32BDD0|nr:DUF4865 family protein [Clostridium hydrogenum]
MIAMQYKIVLPMDYDMKIIRRRVDNNGYKTDGFQDLKFKMYLITEKGVNKNLQNSYCPLYIWKDSNGLNNFLFDGFYDNIITSFGWQKVSIGIPLIDKTTDKIKDSKYAFEIIKEIEPQESLKNLKDKIEKDIINMESKEYLIIYNPDKWKYHVFYFVNELSKVKLEKAIIYSILHVSL